MERDCEVTELENRAHEALHQAFCRMRYFAKCTLNEQGRHHLFLVADAAHNIPDALAGNAYHRPNLERDVLALEKLLEESYGAALSKFCVPQARKGTFFQRLRAALRLC